MENLWLHSVLERYILPDPQVAKEHRSLVELRMRQMEEMLPDLNKVFTGVKVEMAGSVQSDSKVKLNICFMNSKGKNAIKVQYISNDQMKIWLNSTYICTNYFKMLPTKNSALHIPYSRHQNLKPLLFFRSFFFAQGRLTTKEHFI